MEPKKGRRDTRQRRVILEALRAGTDHPTAADLYARVRKTLLHISLGTVYRNLEALADAGEIGRVFPATAERRYDGDAREHYHVRCIKCGRLDDVPPGTAGTRLLSFLLKPTGYDIVGVHVGYTGVCPACARARAAAPMKTRTPGRSDEEVT